MCKVEKRLVVNRAGRGTDGGPWLWFTFKMVAVEEILLSVCFQQPTGAPFRMPMFSIQLS